jgi:hypothetical protein
MCDIDFDKDGNKILVDQDNPKFYLCNRFFTDENYRKFSKLPFDETRSFHKNIYKQNKKFHNERKSKEVPVWKR